MKKTGIWLDKNKAFIVTLQNENETLISINSNIEHFRPHGGSGTRMKGGPQDVVQDSKYLEREKQQMKQYFKEIAFEIRDADVLVIFGPAGTNEKFGKELQEHYKTLSAKVKEIVKVDSMTVNQVKALVRDFYHSK
ncbi:hypothetical protein [uncultured Kordia sp.]|uniref:hypothetical protein n=1 Tax=uncultured Kordia sp. TaxID=507699 RepID=UPI00262015A4|nr:hypothetical protein [uncultured Kordia sp.]